MPTELFIPTWLSELTAFCLTYFVHAAAIVSGVWAICRFAPRLQLSTQNFLWKLAVCGGLLTAILQTGLSQAKLRPVFELGFLSAPTHVERAELEPTSLTPVLLPQQYEWTAESRVPRAAATPEPAVQAAPERAQAVETVKPATVSVWAANLGAWVHMWPWALMGVIAVMVLRALADLWINLGALRRRMAGRREVVEDPALDVFLDTLRVAEIKRPVKLTASPALLSPVAIGRSEICLPERALEELDRAELRAVIGHELAHLERGDAYWLIFATALETLLPFQPLIRVARRHLNDTTEMLCDDWALRFENRGVDLAKSLARVAEWHMPLRGSGLLPASVGSDRPLVARVERLLRDGQARLRQHAGPWTWGAGVAGLAAVVAFAPAAVAEPEKSELASLDDAEAEIEQKERRLHAKLAASDKAKRQIRDAARRVERDLARAEQRAKEARARAELARREAEEELARLNAVREEQGKPPVAMKPLPPIPPVAPVAPVAPVPPKPPVAPVPPVAPAAPLPPHAGVGPGHVVAAGVQPPPMPPMPAIPAVPVLGEVLSSVLGEVTPRVTKGSGRIAMRAKAFEAAEKAWRAAEARLRRAERAGANDRELRRLEREAEAAERTKDRAEEALEREAERFENEMERWGERFERRMEAWAEDYENTFDTEAWEQYGEDMGAWGEAFGAEMEAWAEGLGDALEHGVVVDIDKKAHRHHQRQHRKRARKHKREHKRNHKRRHRRHRHRHQKGHSTHEGTPEVVEIELSPSHELPPEKPSGGIIL